MAELVKSEMDTHSDRYAVCGMDGETFGGPGITGDVTQHMVDNPDHIVVEYEMALHRFEWKLQERADANRPVYR